jgi:hypothetical protein
METKMIQRLEEGHKAAFGFKVAEKLTAEDVATIFGADGTLYRRTQETDRTPRRSL